MNKRSVEVILIAELHSLSFKKIMKESVIPIIRSVIPKNIKNILNFTEGKGLPDSVPDLFNDIYAPKTGFIHMYEYRESNPDFSYIECIKYVLTIVTLLNTTLDPIFTLASEGLNFKDTDIFQGIHSGAVTPDYMEALYTQGYHGDRFAPLSDIIYSELDSAYTDIFNGKINNELYNTKINKSLNRLLEILDEKDCKNKDVLKSIVQNIIEGQDTEGRKAPITIARGVIRDLLDERIIEKIESFIKTRPEITHVIMNIGLSHYKHTVELIQQSSILVMEKQTNQYMREFYTLIDMNNFIKGGKSRRNKRRRRRTFKNTNKTLKRK
jgi:hypothetical protein